MKNYTSPLSIITAFFLFISVFSNAQTVQWAKQGSSQGFDNGNGIYVDAAGNAYVTGQIEYTADFDTYSLASYGIHDIIVAKYNTEGTIEWIHNAGGVGGDIGAGIGVDAAGNTYIAGEIENTANFGSGITLNASGSNDIFIAKYDDAGNISWARRYGSSSNDKAKALAVTSAGNCFMTGYFSSSVNFGGTNLSSSGSNDVFTVKVNSSGTVQWARKGGGNGQDRGNGIAVDKSGNIYVTGTFSGSASFGGNSISNNGDLSTFLVKYNSSGTVQWAKAGGACCDTTTAECIALDENGNIYIAGYFKDATKFGTTSYNSLGLEDIFVVKYDPSGNVVWAKRAGGTDEDIAYGIAVDTINHRVYVTGSVHGPGNFGSLPYTIVGYKDVFVAAYDMSGTPEWVKTNGGGYRDVGSAIGVDPNGYIYTTGIFNDESYFDGITLHGYPNQPWADFYTDKISAEPVASPTTSSSGVSLAQGQCSDLDISFTPGNGSRRIIIAREGFAVNVSPLDGAMYNGDQVFGNGSSLGNGNYVVYEGTGSSATISGLTPGAIVYFSVYEYNGTGAFINYYNTSATGSAFTANYFITISGLQNAICIGDALNLVAGGASTYSWSPSGSLSSGTGASVTATPQTTTIYTVEAIDGQGCHAVRNFTITVNPLPSTSFPNLSSVCLNDADLLLTTGTPTGGVYSGNGVSNGYFIPSTAGTGTQTLLYTYTDGNGCVDDNSATITVHSLPSVSLNSFTSVCQNASPVSLSGGLPSGGDYFGTGVSSGTFNPSIGAGNQTIYYTYTNGNGCADTVSSTITVLTIPQINLGNDTLICADNSIIVNAGAGFSSYAWSTGATTPSITVDSNGTGLDVALLYVVVNNSSGCSNRDSMNVTFDACNGIFSPAQSADDINIFPNPFNDEFSFVTDEFVTFYLYDISGRRLETREHIRGTITAGKDLSAGIYFVEVISGLNRKVFSVIKSE